MKKEILIFTVLITNIAFSSTLPFEIREVREITTNKKKSSTLTDLAITHLYERGLDENAAKQKVLKSLKNDVYLNDLMAQNIIENLKGIKQQDIVSHVSEFALFEKNIDLSLYDNIVAIAQKSNKLALDKLTLEKISKISLENKNIKLKYVI
jgi:hypothetical protein